MQPRPAAVAGGAPATRDGIQPSAPIYTPRVAPGVPNGPTGSPYYSVNPYSGGYSRGYSGGGHGAVMNGGGPSINRGR